MTMTARPTMVVFASHRRKGVRWKTYSQWASVGGSLNQSGLLSGLYKSLSCLKDVISIQTKGVAVKSTNTKSTSACPIRSPDLRSRTAMDACTSGHLRTAGDSEDQDRCDEEHGEQEQRNGCADAEVAAEDAPEVGHAGQHVGRVKGAAPGQDVHDRHVRKGEHGAEQNGHAHDGQKQRQADLKEDAPKARPVHLGAFQHVLGQGAV